MMQAVATLGHALGFSLAAGVNLYATVAILGLVSRFGWVEVPPQFAVFDNNLVIGLALALYLVEFVADKVPWVDSAWDAVHTVIRPVGGAFLAVAALEDVSPTIEAIIGLLGGSVAAGAHLTKMGTRAVANASPEPVSNWALSLAEDGVVIGLGVLTLNFPVAAFAVASAIIILMVVFFGAISRAAWRRWGRGRNEAPV